MAKTIARIERIDHVNIVVDDLALMTRFYHDVLGMDQYKTATIQGEWVDRVVGLNQVVADVVFLRMGHGSNLELIKYRASAGTRPDQLACPNTHGLRHIAFRVYDIEEVCSAIRREGVEFLGMVQGVPTGQFNVGNGARKKLVYFHDPEDNLLELCSYEE